MELPIFLMVPPLVVLTRKSKVESVVVGGKKEIMGSLMDDNIGKVKFMIELRKFVED